MHYYQLLIRGGRVRKVSLYVLDFGLWLLLLLIIFSILLIINLAEIRIYIFLALILGLLIYYHFISDYLNDTLGGLAKVTIKMVKFIRQLFIWPIRRAKAAFNNLRTIEDNNELPP